VLPLIAVEAAAAKLSNSRLPWADLICMPITSLIRPPAPDDAREFEREMEKRCGTDFIRHLALSVPVAGGMSKRDIFCPCRYCTCVFVQSSQRPLQLACIHIFRVQV
jgi:hypothetical protein